MAQYYTRKLSDGPRPEADEALKEYQVVHCSEYARDKLLLGLVYGRMGYLYRRWETSRSDSGL